mgnify:CR=1 FL=1
MVADDADDAVRRAIGDQVPGGRLVLRIVNLPEDVPVRVRPAPDDLIRRLQVVNGLGQIPLRGRQVGLSVRPGLEDLEKRDDLVEEVFHRIAVDRRDVDDV